LAAAAALWTICHIPNDADFGSDKKKLREFLVLDIRAINQYCAIYLTLIGVIATIAASQFGAFKAILNDEHLWPFGLAFLASAVSTFFLPAGYKDDSFWRLQALWARSVICEQVAVIFTCYGIWNAYTVLAP
jgi:hypothetical protein